MARICRGILGQEKRAEKIHVESTPASEPKSAPLCSVVHLLGSVFCRTDSSRIFIFEPPDFFLRILSLLGKKSAQKNPPR